MKTITKLLTVFTIVLISTSSFAEVGMTMTNYNLASTYAKDSKKSSSGGGAFAGKGSKTISIGLGMSSYLGAFGKGGFSRYGGRGYIYGGFWYSGTLSVQAEFGVHDYVGVGLVTGFGGRSYKRFGSGTGGVMYVPVGVIANFHFFQLIADKKNLGIGDDLDLYVGLNVGSGLAVGFPTGSGSVGGMLFAGPQIGLKYFFNDKIGVYTEFGYGKSLIEGGVSIKL